jgi:glycogen synthase
VASSALQRSRGNAHHGEDLAVLPIALAAARSARIPLVVTLHTSLRHGFFAPGVRGYVLGGVGGTLETAVCVRAQAVISLSARLTPQLCQDGVATERIHVIPPGVNSSEFASDSPDPFPDLARPRVVFVGRLVHQKGVDTLVAAANIMRRTAAQVLLVGDGPLRPEIEANIRARGLQDRVRVAGFRSHAEIPSILCHSDVFCLPSRYEELPSALLEAMYAGLPIVASNVGAVPETLDGAGQLVAPDDAPALARAIDELLSDADLAARLGATAQQRSRAYEWSRLAKRVLGVYRLALTFRPTNSSRR